MSSSGTKMVTFRTSDGQLFDVEEDVVVMRSPLMKSYLQEDAASYANFVLIDVDVRTMAKVSEYWKKHSGIGGLSEQELKDFDKEFLEVPHSVLYDVLIAANRLGDDELAKVISQEVADRMTGKTPEEIREEFNIVNDYTPEEEEEIRNEIRWAFD